MVSVGCCDHRCSARAGHGDSELEIKDLVSSGVGYDRRAGEGRGDGYGSVRRDRYDRRVGSVGSVNRAVSVRGAGYDRSVGSDLIIIAFIGPSLGPRPIVLAS